MPYIPIISRLRAQARAVASSNGILSPQEVDAFTHAYTSAMLANNPLVGPGNAKFLGDLNEVARPSNPIRDRNMDLWKAKGVRDI